MELSAFEWTIIGGVATLAIGVIGFFLKRTMSRVDKHDEDIRTICQDYARKDVVEAQGKDINQIKLTYVTEEDLHKMESEIKGDIRTLNNAVNEIRTNYLTAKDFYRTQGKTEQQLDRIYQMLISGQGGNTSGKQ